MEIDLPWTAVMAELRFMRSSVKTETTKMTGIVKITMMILALKKWLFKVILNLTDAALAVATI